MTEEIKERIETINRGEVPQGYKKTKVGIVPSEWEVSKLGAKMNIFRGASPRPKGDPKYYGGNIPRLMIEDVTRDGKYAYPCIDSLTEEGAKKSRFLKKGSIVMSCSGTRVGIVGFLGVDACIHDGFFGFSEFKNLNLDFIYFLFMHQAILLQSSATTGGVFNNLTTDIMRELLINFPPLPEQEKIAEILTTCDKVIELKEKLIAEKQRQKKWLMQNLLTGKKRLQGFDGEWKKVKLGKCIKEVNEKTTRNNQHEILSVTKNGIFKQSEHFNKQIASDNNTGYKILKKGNLVFSTMNLWMGSVDVLQEYDIGIVSPAYKTLDFIKEFMIIDFGKHYMKSSFMVWIYNINSEQGASIVRKNLDMDGLLSTKIPIPTIQEQTAIATILSTADHEIDLLEKDVSEWRNKKKALMQLLLTGKVRVNE